MTSLFTYNEEKAVLAGQGGYINESGAYIFNLMGADLIQTSGGAKGIQFSGETDDGRKINYLTVYYKKKDGTENIMGTNMINAIMGCADVESIDPKQHNGSWVAPEFIGKKVGFLLQKTLRTKEQGEDAGKETYSFEIIMPFYPNTQQTVLEHAKNRAAESIAKRLQTLTDKDERKSVPHSDRTAPGNSTYPPVDTYDDIPY